MANVGTPFKAPSAQRLPDILVGCGRVVIRVDDTTGTDKIIIRIDPNAVVDAAHANFFLKAGESIEISGHAIQKASDVSVLATSGTPDIYWGIV